MEKYWFNNIYYALKDSADLEIQKKIWFGLDRNQVSSFGEDISLLFDSFDFNNFIEEFKIENVNPELLNRLILFRDSIELYINKVYKNNNNPLPDKYIIHDPQWFEVVDKAKEAIRLWDSSDLPH